MVQFLDLTDVDVPLHAWINDLGNMEKIIYNFNSRDFFPKRTPVMEAGKHKGKAAALAVQRAKLEFRDEAREKLHLVLDTPDPAGYGGSTDNANSARKFFGYEDRDAVVSLFKVLLFHDYHYFFHWFTHSNCFRTQLNKKEQTFGKFCKIHASLIGSSILPKKSIWTGLKNS